MRSLDKTIKNMFRLVGLLIIFAVLTSCGGPFKWDPADARKVDPNVEVRARKALEEGRGLSLNEAWKFGRGQGGVFQFASSNPLWRATIEVLDFLPLANVDYSGGLVITDWYNESTADGESIKITVRFLSNEVRSDGIVVIVHKKICTKLQNCTVSKIKSSLEMEVKTAILKRAAVLEKMRVDEYREYYQKKYGDRAKQYMERENN